MKLFLTDTCVEAKLSIDVLESLAIYFLKTSVCGNTAIPYVEIKILCPWCELLLFFFFFVFIYFILFYFVLLYFIIIIIFFFLCGVEKQNGGSNLVVCTSLL